MHQSEKKWVARDAWKCVLALVLADFVLFELIHAGVRNNRAFAGWWGRAPLALAVSVVTQAALFLLATWFFSRVRSVREFVARTGLSLPPTTRGWGLAWVAVGIGVVDFCGGSLGWTSSGSASSRRHYHSLTLAAFSFSVVRSTLITPIYEELVTRGFLYRAFRGTFGFLPTTCLILCFSGYFHWGSVSHSLFTAGCLGSLWVVLCCVRERTDSLWDCIVCHAAYNAIVTGQWLPCLAGLLSVLLVILRLRRSSAPAKS